MREEGYYWVKRYGFWSVGKWVEQMSYWYIPGVSFALEGDSSLEEIDERRIVREESSNGA